VLVEAEWSCWVFASTVGLLSVWTDRAEMDTTCPEPDEAVIAARFALAETTETSEVVTKRDAATSGEDPLTLPDPSVEGARRSEWRLFVCLTFLW
jgi:hypothetical protein